MGEATLRLDDGLMEFLKRPLMSIIAAVDEEGRPAPARAIGFHVLEDQETIDVIFSGWQWPRLEPSIRATGKLAVTFVSPCDYVTYQVKGAASMRETDTCDLAQAERFMADATGALENLGVPSAIIAPWLTPREARVARLVVSEIYIQTPGPQAGMMTGARAR
ncbi:MAG: pyridoxamine 5'-phosphate oxidase family protein [Sphingobium sp.]|nr:pyridoxamine 5'-phosphate oxidase family protein [Sphingobium sp.]